MIELDLLPEGDPVVNPSWAHLVRAPCSVCAGARLFPQLLRQRNGPDLPLYGVTVLCGDCGHVDERRDPDDKWEQLGELQDYLARFGIEWMLPRGLIDPSLARYIRDLGLAE